MGFGGQFFNSVTLIGSLVANGSVNGCFNGQGSCFVNVISNFSWKNADVQRKPRPIRISMVFTISQKLWLSQGLNIAMPYELRIVDLKMYEFFGTKWSESNVE